jgi:sulfur carrier protein
MNIYIEKDKKQIVLEEELSVKELLSKLEINPETVMVVKNNEVVLDDEQIGKEDEIKILSVVSGG